MLVVGGLTIEKINASEKKIEEKHVGLSILGRIIISMIYIQSQINTYLEVIVLTRCMGVGRGWCISLDRLKYN